MTVSAEWIARALGGQRCGASWTARCPAHEDQRPSLSISARGGRVLVHCHAGCRQRAVIAALQVRGLWAGSGGRFVRADVREPMPRVKIDEVGSTAQRVAKLFSETVAAHGTPVEVYLRGRGLCLPESGVLRFHRCLRHPGGQAWLGMVAPVVHGRSGETTGLHRTFLAPGGLGKAPVKPDRMMLGPCRGGAVRLGEAGETLLVGEGIETCLSAMQASGLPAWAALSAGGYVSLDLPECVRHVVLLADGDPAGLKGAEAGALRWAREGRDVRIAEAPAGQDFNDVLLGKAAPVEAKR